MADSNNAGKRVPVVDQRYETEFGSSFLVVSIVGGALVALLSDRLHSVHLAMLVSALCFAVCLACGRMAPPLGKRA